MTEQQIEEAQGQLLTELSSIESTNTLEQFKLEHLTRKGTIAQYFERLKDVPKESKPVLGKVLNAFRQVVETAVTEKEATLGGPAKKSEPILDLTMPPRP